MNKIIENLKEELDTIKTEKIKTFIEKVLDSCDEMNATEPASSTGKYHPVADLGNEGLIRHSKMVAKLTEIMIRSIPYYDDDLHRDIIFSAALIHDMAKYDKSNGKYSQIAHPMILAKKIRELNTEDDPDFEKIATIIETHMSRWNDISKRPFEGVNEMPLPKTLEQYIVVFADLISANATLPEYMMLLKEEAIRNLVGRV